MIIQLFCYIFHLEEDRAKTTLAMFILNFFIGFSSAFLSVTSTSIFLSNYSATLLPYQYIGIAIFAPIFGFLYHLAAKKVPFPQLIKASLLIILLSVFLFGLILEIEPYIFSFVIFIYGEICWIYLNFLFWRPAETIFTIREIKKTFGFIGAGRAAGVIVGSLIISSIVNHFEMNTLFISSALPILGTFITMVYVLNREKDKLLSNVHEPEEKEKIPSFVELFKNSYVLMIFGVSTLAYFIYYFIDNIFFLELQMHYPEKADIAKWVSYILLFSNTLIIIVQTFFLSDFFNRFGFTGGVISYSAVCTIGAAGMILSWWWPQGSLLFFWCVVITKFFERVLADSIDRIAMVLIYQPLIESIKANARIVCDSFINPLAGLISGIILLLFIEGLKFNTFELSVVLILISIFDITLCYRAARDYYLLLKHSISSHWLHKVGTVLKGRESIALLENSLQSPHPEEVIYALNLFQETEYPNLHLTLIKLLDHPALEIRRYVLKRIGRLSQQISLSPLLNRLKVESEPKVKSDLLQIIAKLGKSDMIDLLVPYIEDPNSEIKLGATVGLLKSCGIRGVIVAGTHFLRWIESKDSENRKLAAAIIGRVGIEEFNESLEVLLKDPDIEVRREALTATIQLKSTQLLPHILSLIEDNTLSNEVIHALSACGKETLYLIAPIYREEKVQREIMLTLTRVLGDIHHPLSIELLFEKVNHEDLHLRLQVLFALHGQQVHATEKQKMMLFEMVERELSDIVWLLSTLEDVKDLEPFALMRHEISIQKEKAFERIFYALALIFVKEPILNICLHFADHSPKKRSHGLEVLNNLLEEKIKNTLIPLLEIKDPNHLLNTVYRYFKNKATSPTERIREILSTPYNHSKIGMIASALYAMIKLKLQREDLYALAYDLLFVSSSYLQRGAAAVIMACYPSKTQQILQELTLKNKIELVKWMREAIDAEAKKSLFYSDFEKLIALKDSMLFGKIDNDDLVLLLQDIQVVSFSKGEYLIHISNIANPLFILVSGSVAVLNREGEEVSVVGQGASLGEISIFFDDLTLASCVAKEEVIALSIDKKTMQGLLKNNQKFTEGVINVLINNIEQTSRKLFKSSTEEESKRETTALQTARKENPREKLSLLEKALFLSKLELFDCLNDHDLNLIAYEAREVYFLPEEQLIREGEVGDCMYLVISGEADLLIEGIGKIGKVKKGDVIGEFALFSKKPRRATCLVKSPLTALIIEKFEFSQLIKNNTAILYNIAKSLTKRLVKYNEDIVKRP